MASMKAGSEAGSPAGNMRNPNQRGPRPQRVHVMPRRGKRGKGGTADQRAASNAECQMSKYMVKMCQLSYLIWSRCYFITPNVRLCVSVAAVAAVAAVAVVAVAAVRASAHNERCCSKAAGSAGRWEGGG